MRVNCVFLFFNLFIVASLCLNLANSDKYESEECGVQYTSDRIAGGTMTNLDEFPWMGLIVYKAGDVVSVGCGGALINHRYVLTAAHCIKGSAAKHLGKIVAVRLGEHDLGSAIDCDSSDIEENCAPPPIDYFVESVHPHLNYNPASTDRHNDIGLIRLNQTVSYSRYIRPICLPSKSFRTSSVPKQTLQVCGWGKTETRASSSGVKLKAEVPIVSKDKCQGIYAARGVKVVDSQICAGGGKSDTCKGDSGGPIMTVYKPSINEERWYAVGVVSFGSERCPGEGIAAIYTSTNYFLDWISLTIKP